MFRRSLLLILFSSFLLISCGRITNEFNFIDEKDEQYKYYSYKMTASSGNYNITFYSGTKSSYGGYGAYGQLIRDYSSGDLTSILKNDDTCFTIKSNETDSRGLTSNIINWEISFPKKTVSTIDFKAAYSAGENSYIESGVITSPLALSNFKFYVTDSSGTEKELSVKFSGVTTLDTSLTVGYEISAVRITATMSKYYGSYSKTSTKYSDLSTKRTDAQLSIYKVILN